MRKVKRAMTTLGRLEEPEDEPSGILDRPLNTAIRGFQRDKGLRVDGFMRPDGPTRRSLQSDLLGFLREEKESDRGDASDGFRSGSLNPAAALLGERDSAIFDRDVERSDRSSGLLEVAERTSSAGGLRERRSARNQEKNDRRHGKDHERLASGNRESRSDRDALATSGRSRAKTAAGQAPKETEPARLKPFLDKAERHFRHMVEDWRKQGMTDAARHLKHFLDGSGEPITYNRDQARSFGPVRNAEQEAHQELGAAIAKQLTTKRDEGKLLATSRGGHGSIRHVLELGRGVFGNRDTMGDNVAVGRTGVTAKFEGSVEQPNDDLIVVDGIVKNSWRDDYDFHGTTGLELPQLGADAALSLQRYRGARPFEMRGVWDQRVTGRIRRKNGRWLPALEFLDLD